MNRARLEINHSSPHIKEGCSSHLKPGEGKEANRRLHNTLTSSSLCGANTVGPEQGVATISLVFYAINCKKGGRKHDQNARIVPFILPFKSSAHNVNEIGTNFNSDSSYQVSLDNAWRRNLVRNQRALEGEILDEIIVIKHM